MFSTILAKKSEDVDTERETTYKDLKERGLTTTSDKVIKNDANKNNTLESYYLCELYSPIQNVLYSLKTDFNSIGFLNNDKCDQKLFKIIKKQTILRMTNIEYDEDDCDVEDADMNP
jgi:hypothetical protein